MPKIFAKDNESTESVLRRFKRVVEKAGVLTEIRKRAAHEPKSVIKKKAKDAAARRFRKLTSRLKSAQETVRRHH